MTWLTDLLDLALPQRCAGCERPVTSPSPPDISQARLPASSPPEPSTSLCRPCLARLSRPPRLAWPDPPPRGLPPPWAAASYEASVRATIVAYKERGRTGLATPLGTALAQALQAALTTPQVAGACGGGGLGGGEGVVVVPVPSARGAVRRRGHDPVRRLAGVAVARLRGEGLDVVAVDALRQARRVADQAGLGAGRRAANLAEALRAAGGGEAVRGRRVVVVDDVITTGATLAEAARALRAVNAQVVAVATVAATPRWESSQWVG